jgi:hypothetical protein
MVVLTLEFFMKTILFLAAAATMASAQTPAPGAMVFGIVQSNIGAPIPGAWVTIYRDTADPDKPAPPFMSGTASWKDGAFAFTGLEAGIYHFCASLPGSTWLNNCDWETKRIVVQLNANQMTKDVVVSLKRGVALPIRIDDAGGLLDKNEKSRAGAHVLVGVGTTSGMFQPAAVTASDKQGRTHEVLIPFDAPVKLVVQSDLFQMATDKGVAFASGRNESTVNIPAGSSASTITVKVTGIKP